MTPPAWHRWLRQTFAARPAAARRPRLRFERLEDRTNPTAYTVTSFADDGSAGTLRSILTQVNADPAGGGADTISFAGGGTVTLTHGQLEISRTAGPVTIDGGGNAVTISGNNKSRVFQIDANVTAALTGLTITGGNGAGSTKTGFGGGVYNAGSLTMTASTLSNNTVSQSGGGIFNDHSPATLAVVGSTLSGNAARGSFAAPGGVDLTYYLGGSADPYAFLDYLGTSFQGYGGGVANFGGTATVTGSTLAGNFAQGLGGGVANVDVLYSLDGTVYHGNLTVADSTVFGNQAEQFDDGGIASLEVVPGGAPTGPVTIGGSIVSGNTVANAGHSGEYDAGATDGVVGFFNDNGYNLFGAIGGAGDFTYTGKQGTRVGHDIFSNTPLLAPLGDYGGPTPTLALLPGSPALDVGNPSDAGADQRGVGVQNRRRDIGAFESRGFAVTAAGGDYQSALPNQAFAQPLTLTVAANDPGLTDLTGVVVTFAAPSAGTSATLSATSLTLTRSGTASVTATANGYSGQYVVVASAGGGPANAATFHLTNTGSNSALVVNSLGDPANPAAGQTTLRSALAYADTFTSGSPTITFDPAVFNGTEGPIVLTQGQLQIANPNGVTVTIDGAAGGARGVTVSGNNASRVFQVDPNVTAVLTGLTITGGNGTSVSNSGDGGGVYNAGTLTVQNSTLSGNTAA